MSEISLFRFCLRERFHFPLHLTLPILCRGVCDTLSGVLAVPKNGTMGETYLRVPVPGTTYQGPAPAGSRDTLRRNGVGERGKVKGKKKRLDLPWFTQKANKVCATRLALFTEATGALSVG